MPEERAAVCDAIHSYQQTNCRVASRMVKDTIRLWKDGLKDMVMEVSCGLHNFRVRTTPWPSSHS